MAQVLALVALVAFVLGGSDAALVGASHPDAAGVRHAAARPAAGAQTALQPVEFASALALDGGVEVAWVPVGPPPVSYLVSATEPSGRVAAAVRVCGRCDVASLSGLRDGTPYAVRVAAVGADGLPGPPAEAGSVTPERPPRPPLSATAAVAGPLSAVVHFVPAPQPKGAGPVERYVVQVQNAETGAYEGAVYACAACHSATVGGLSAGETYRFAVMAQDAAGDSLAVTTNAVRITANGCPLQRVCVTVGPSTDGPALRRADGLLMGASAATPPGLVEALAPRQWRVVYGPAERLAKGYGALTTEMLSDAWYDATSAAGGGALAPWADWPRYERFVAAYVERAIERHVAPSFWDVQNEPGPDYLAHGAIGSPILWLETYRVAATIIEHEDPGAGVVGPSIGVFADAPGRGVPGAPDLASFVDFVARYHLPLAALSFHEIGPLSRVTTPQVVADDVARAKALLVAAGLSSAGVFVNEYGTWPGLLVPGDDVGMIAALEASDVTEANLTCYRMPSGDGSTYSGCGPDGVLDGLLTRSFRPRPAYLVYEAYAKMGGTRLVASSTDRSVSAFATLDEAQRRATVLVGREEREGARAGGPGSRAGAGRRQRAASPLDLEVLGLGGLGVGPGTLVKAVIGEIPDAVSALRSPEQLATEVVPATGTGVRLALPALPQGAALVVTLEPDGG